MTSVKIPKILFLALDIASFYRKSYYNTNDLTTLANQYKNDLVRSRADKKDYKYLEDTKFGGLRGNFSTLLTWKGFVRRQNKIVPYCSVGRDDRLVNAICNGEIVLNRATLTAHTNNPRLAHLLETEAALLNLREKQAHIKNYLEENPQIKLTRVSSEFPKVSVVRSDNNVYFVRASVNNFLDFKNTILEYDLLNLWEGKKFNKRNIHPLIVLPSTDNAWSEIYAIKNEDLYEKKPLLLDINLAKKICVDKEGNEYKLYPLDEAIATFSNYEANIEERLGYNWTELQKRETQDETALKEQKQDEFLVFLNMFLQWKKEFSIEGKDVVKIDVSSSGGPDVKLIFSGGTSQQVELEHNWKNYLDHRHHTSNAWRNVWLFAEEEWDPALILRLFKPFKDECGDRIPDTFLCLERGERKAYRADWSNSTFNEIPLSFS